MNLITNTEEATKRVKELYPETEDVQVIINKEPLIFDSKKFWPVSHINTRTNEESKRIGGELYLADNGQLITIGSSDLLDGSDASKEEMESRLKELLLAMYNGQQN